MADYSKQFEQMKVIVKGFDSDLSLKANKFTITEIYDKFAKVDESLKKVSTDTSSLQK
jgi:hypothetical protein